jgi:hypothetical protein
MAWTRARTTDLVTPPAMLYALVYAIIRRVLLLSGIPSDSEAEVLVLHHELAVLRRQIKRPKLHRRDKLFLAAMSRMLPRERCAAFIVAPATLVRWHRELVLAQLAGRSGSRELIGGGLRVACYRELFDRSKRPVDRCTRAHRS